MWLCCCGKLRQAMVTRRSRGEGALFWHEGRQRWMAVIDIGFTPEGKRRRSYVSAKTKTEARAKLLAMRRDQADGLPGQHLGYTVGEAVESWLQYGLAGRDHSTIENRRILAQRHVIPSLGGRRLVELSAEDVDVWLAEKARTLSTDTVHRLLSILRRSIRRAQGRDLVRRNVALLCEPPRGTEGRPSKSLSLDQANAVLTAAAGTSMHAYLVLSLLTGARTEELRALTWTHLDLDGDPPTIELWHSVRAGRDTKTKRSRRTLELADRCVEVLRLHRREQVEMRVWAGGTWQDHDLVFSTQVGTELDAATSLPADCRRRRARRPNLDAPRAAALIRVAAVKLWHAYRGHLAPGRTLQHCGNREGLPQGTTSCAYPRRAGDERVV